MPGNEAATKSDLAGLKEELKLLATKEEFKRLALDQAKIHTEIRDLKLELTELITESSSKIMKAVQDFGVEVRKVDRREIITSHRVDKLEERIETLESKQDPPR